MNPLSPRGVDHCSTTVVTTPGRRVVEGSSRSNSSKRLQSAWALRHHLHAAISQVGGMAGKA